jgi:hypothetical protein
MNAETPAANLTETAIVNLDALAACLTKEGWRARLDRAYNRVPNVFVQNPEPGARALSDHVYAAPRAGGWWFWWSWAEPIAEDPADAAAIIMRALRSAGNRPPL